MAHSLSSLLLLGATLSPLLHAVSADSSLQFDLSDQYIGRDFLSKFSWETLDDPTHGRVNYVDQRTAMERNLTYASDNKFVMRVDNKNAVQPDSRGRDSNRIISRKAHSDSVIVIDLQHMPEGCGTWPAFWTLSQNGPWPNGGEIDIIEGVNTQSQNLATLHTTDGCTQAQNRDQQGTTVTTDCNARHNDNQGCGTVFPSASSYGAGFNAAGGGWYAMVRTVEDGIAVYFWGRNDPTVPSAVKYGSNPITVDESWGQPQARFEPNSCDMRSHFDAHNMVFDTTLCGDWAGNTFTQMGCGGNCKEFVDNNPTAFTNAYWEINSLRVFTPQQRGLGL